LFTPRFLDLRLRGEEAKRRREEQLSIEQNRSSQLEKQCQEATERLQQDLLNAQNEVYRFPFCF